MISAPIQAIIDAECGSMNLGRSLIRAMVEQESSGIPCRARFEPKFNYLWHPVVYAQNLIQSTETETNQQMTSWGLMQIMGATARELGFTGYMPELCDPTTGLHWACVYFKSLMVRYSICVEDSISAYNQGKPRKTPAGLYLNEQYVDQVMNRKRDWEKTLGDDPV